MGQGQAEIDIKAAPDKVWAAIGDFGGLGTWMPGIESCELQGEDRVLKMMGMEITERLLKKDDDARSITYGIVAGPFPLQKHEATITVAGDGDSSHVTWAVDVDDAMTDMMVKTYEGGLAALKAHAEG
jgi:carbon monoxide dehydrogenase subunit G